MQDTLTHPRLLHLSKDEINDLSSRYYMGEKISSLCNEFKIKYEPKRFYKLLPPLINSSRECPNCGCKLVSPKLPRNSPSQNERPTLWQCSQCNHKEFNVCRCLYCLGSKKDKETPTHKLSSSPLIRVQDLTLELAIALCSLCYWDQEARENKVAPDFFDNETMPFAPISDYGNSLLEKLIQHQVIAKVKPPECGAFSLFGMNIILGNVAAYEWAISPDERNLLLEDFDTLIEDKSWLEYWRPQIPEVLNAIALAECEEFYSWCAKKRNFPISEKTAIRIVLSSLLATYSVAQCHYIIRECAIAAADYLVQTNCSPSIASGYLLNECQQWSSETNSATHTVPALKRNPELRRSTISLLLLNIILGYQSDIGFEVALNKIQLPSLDT